jgi:Putative beta-barrel porin 2
VRRRPARLLPVAALFVLLPCRALAEDTVAERPGRFHTGPFWLTPRLEIRSAGYDTNVYNAQTGAISDPAFVIAPGLVAALPLGRRLTLEGRGLVSWNWFSRETSERSVDKDAGVRATLRFDKVELFGDLGWGEAKQRFSLDLDERLLHQDTSQAFGARLKLARKLTLSGSAQWQSFDIEGPTAVQASLDHESLTLGLEGGYELTKRTQLTFRLERITDTFDQSIGSPGREVQSGRYMGGFSFGTRAAITGRLLLGVREFPGEVGSAAPPYTGPALDVSLGTSLGRLGQLQLQAEREVQYSATPGVAGGELVRNSYVNGRYRAQLQSELVFDFIGRVFVQWQTGDYQLPTLVDGVPVDRDATLHVYGFSLLKALGPTLRIGGGYTWESRDSTLPGDSYRSSRYGIQAEYVP